MARGRIDPWAPSRVKVTLPNGSFVPVPVFLCDTVGLLKESFLNREPRFRGRLISLFFNGRVIDDDEVLSSCRIVTDSVVELRVRVTVRILPIDLSYTVYQDETVDSLLRKASHDAGVPTDDFALCLRGRELSGSSTLQESGISDGSDLALERRSRRAAPAFTLTVRLPDGRCVAVPVRSSCQVSEVCAQVILRAGLRPEPRIRLVYGEKLMDGCKRLEDYHVERDATVDVVFEESDDAMHLRRPGR